MPDSIENNVAAIRAQLKQRRADQDPVDMRRGALLIRGRLFTWLATYRQARHDAGLPVPSRIAAFWPLPSEPDLEPLLFQWVEEEDLSISLPVVDREDGVLSFRTWTPDTPMRTGAFGIQEPQGPEAPPPDIVLVPTLGFTRQGDRVGYGKGHYDRTLAHLKAQGHPFVTLGVAWACGDLSGQAYRPAPHDVPLDSILTDKGWPVPALV
ncbi:5-formyltetrahydrofolate cyclo-ligase [Pusillimonas sp. CC-YST705]|uniref:5-formyltetrahydrofolate cyclo-ligase n=1 Tax=Mesopusillimonas faecipullorum TaxID=2755040 RepID=A0ABS8CDV0_9BURK|nr:5-formyltetrahydrofolate cyclo-ligase [Mesopusillimonas faecipullorum]MCB5364216.1 5-formyltetrahydrofolate cyclo-ligase [Mesopusillimonas faecipullorum]